MLAFIPAYSVVVLDADTRGKILVITDSTASLPSSLAQSNLIEVVNLHVLRGGRSYEENLDTSASECAMWVSQHEDVATSQPSLQAFEQAFSAAALAGCSGVVVACISSALSGTFSTASMAVQRATLPVQVVDSKTSAMALGLAAVAGAESAQTGANLDSVAHAVREASERSGAFFMVDSLDHLRRGGRLSAAAAALGTVLGLKPILHITDDGGIDVYSKVRSRNAALKSLLEISESVVAQNKDVRFGVHFFGDEDRAQALAQNVRESTGREVYVSAVSAVLGVHVGPGLVALTYA